MNFCSHILLCNILTTILRPNFEDFLDTKEQFDEQNITLYSTQHATFWKSFLNQSSHAEYRKLGKNMVFANDSAHYHNIHKYDTLGKGKHAMLGAYVTWKDMEYGENTT